VERFSHFLRVKDKVTIIGAFKNRAHQHRKTRLDDRGIVLVILMIIIGIISILSMTTLASLRREVKKVNNDYFNLVASYAAESGIELAKSDIFSGKNIDYSQSTSSRKLQFEYGSEHFPEGAGRIINCRVTAYVHPDRVYIESNAKVLDKSVSQGRSHIIAERTSKKLIRVIGSPPMLSRVWQVCN
jgi:hypothetical protein